MSIIQIDEHGTIELVTHMGDDAFIGQTAVRSKAKNSPTDLEQLIRHLYRKGHMSPFEFVEFVFDVYAPIFVAREWVRHRTASWSELSGRATQLPGEFYMPPIWRRPAPFNKQSSADPIPAKGQEEYTLITQQHYAASLDAYTYLLNNEVAYEQARLVMPVAGYTMWRWKIDLRNLLGFLKQRAAPDATEAFRMYAEAIIELIRPIVPLTVRAFEEYTLNAFTLSAEALRFIQDVAKGVTRTYLINPSEWRELFTALNVQWDGLLEFVKTLDGVASRPENNPLCLRDHTPYEWQD